jgi:hypothetical protein
MVGSYSDIEFAFSRARFIEAMTPFLSDVKSQQIFCVSGGLHYLAGVVFFTTMTVICAWAANHDKTWDGKVGDMMCWMMLMGWLLDVAAQSILISAFIGQPPAGFFYADPIVYVVWGIQLVFKDLTLATGLIYGIVIRILAWTIWKDVNNTPPLEGTTLTSPKLQAAQGSGVFETEDNL